MAYHLQIGTCHLPLQVMCFCTADFQHILKGVQGGEQNGGILCLGGGGTGRRGLQIDILGMDFMSPILIYPHV